MTSLTYRLPEKQEMATLINIDYPQVGIEKVAEVALTYQQLFKDLDRRMNLKMAMYHSGTKGIGVKLTGFFYGSKTDAIHLLAAFSSAPCVELEEMSILEANRAIQDGHQVSFQGLGGAISDISSEETAFYYRDARFILGFQSVFEDKGYKEQNNAFVRERFNELCSYTKGSFINFPIEQGENYEKEYYGDNLARLKDVKRKYDPINLFKFEQSIRG